MIPCMFSKLLCFSQAPLHFEIPQVTRVVVSPQILPLEIQASPALVRCGEAHPTEVYQRLFEYLRHHPFDGVFALDTPFYFFATYLARYVGCPSVLLETKAANAQMDWALKNSQVVTKDALLPTLESLTPKDLSEKAP